VPSPASLKIEKFELVHKIWWNLPKDTNLSVPFSKTFIFIFTLIWTQSKMTIHFHIVTKFIWKQKKDEIVSYQLTETIIDSTWSIPSDPNLKWWDIMVQCSTSRLASHSTLFYLKLIQISNYIFLQRSPKVFVCSLKRCPSRYHDHPLVEGMNYGQPCNLARTPIDPSVWDKPYTQKQMKIGQFPRKIPRIYSENIWYRRMKL